jgi:nicotinamidase-related amidase
MDTIISAEPLNGVRIDLHHEVVVEESSEEEEALRSHDSIMQELRTTIRQFHAQRSSSSYQRHANPGLVFKDKQNAKEFLVGEVEPVPLDCNDGPFNGDTPLDDDMMEAVAMALAEIKLQMAGVATSSGVEATARNAYDHGYNVTLVVDAMTDLSPDAHRHSVETIFPQLGESR